MTTGAVLERDELELCRALAQRARHNALTAVESGLYTGAVERVFARLLAVQNERTPSCHLARGEIRVRRVIPVVVRWGERTLKAVTLDLGLGGFSSLLDSAPRRGTEVEVRVSLAGGLEISTTARVVGVAHRGGAVRVSFAFRGLDGPGRALLQASLVEDAVAQLAIAAAPQAPLRVAVAAEPGERLTRTEARRLYHS
jgi:hypothetical protein